MLGWRIKKETVQRQTNFVWDSNTILHEWESGSEADLTTWVFEEGSMTPSAKLTAEGSYSIFSNYLGVPMEAYDEAGKLVWRMSLDIYGNVREIRGDRDLIPFRFPGQYADEHSGLYYNRHRYYNPEHGCYTQVDPIRLNGGNPTLYGYVTDPNSLVDLFGLRCPPVSNKTTASNGLNYQSNPKHTPGNTGYRNNAGIEPRNSLDLFEDSVPSTSKPNHD